MFSDSTYSISDVITRNIKILKKCAKDMPEKFSTTELVRVLPAITKALHQTATGQDISSVEDIPFDFYHSPLPNRNK